MMPAGAVNAWRCVACGGLTVAVHVDEGVTPMFLACRRTDGCPGRAVSSGYPAPPVPDNVIDLLAWEWWKPTGRQYRRLSPEMRSHVDRGGLDLRPLTDAGRRAYVEGPIR
jgi:hypothetical protein